MLDLLRDAIGAAFLLSPLAIGVTGAALLERRDNRRASRAQVTR